MVKRNFQFALSNAFPASKVAMMAPACCNDEQSACVTGECLPLIKPLIWEDYICNDFFCSMN